MTPGKKPDKIWSHYDTFQVEGFEKKRCKYCKSIFGPQNATKKKRHTAKCKSAPEFVRKEFLEYVNTDDPANDQEEDIPLAILQKIAPPSTSRLDEDKEKDKSSTGTESRKRKGVAPFLDSMKPSEQKTASGLLALACYVTGTPLDKPCHPLWKRFFTYLRPSFQPPSYYALRVPLLENEYGKMKKEVAAKISDKKHLHLQLDAWSNRRNEGLVYVILNVPEPVFTDFIDTKDNHHTGEYFRDEIKKLIIKYGVEKFGVLMGDNGKNIQKSFRLIAAEYPHITYWGCAAHTCHLLCGDILKKDSVKAFFKEVICVIKTVRKSQILTACFIKIREKMKIRQSLRMPGNTRWGSSYVALRSVLKCKKVLMQLAIDDNAQESFKDHMDIRMKMLDEEFYKRCKKLSKILRPICKSITKLEGDEPRIWIVHSLVNSMIEKVKDALQVSDFSFEDKFSIETSIDFRRKQLIRPIHLAAVILNPKSQGNDLTQKEITTGYQFIKKLANNLKFNGGKMIADIIKYRRRIDEFKSSVLWAKDGLEALTPIDWWVGFFENTDLSYIAERILTAPVTSAATERSFSTFGHQHSAKRNGLKTERAAKLTYVAHNYKLQHPELSKKSKKKEKDESESEEEDEHEHEEVAVVEVRNEGNLKTNTVVVDNDEETDDIFDDFYNEIDEDFNEDFQFEDMEKDELNDEWHEIFWDDDEDEDEDVQDEDEGAVDVNFGRQEGDALFNERMVDFNAYLGFNRSTDRNIVSTVTIPKQNVRIIPNMVRGNTSQSQNVGISPNIISDIAIQNQKKVEQPIIVGKRKNEEVVVVINNKKLKLTKK